MRCPVCGAEARDSARRCMNCGENLQEVDNSAPANSSPQGYAPGEITRSNIAHPGSAIPYPAHGAAPPAPTRAKSHRQHFIVGGIIAFLVSLFVCLHVHNAITSAAEKEKRQKEMKREHELRKREMDRIFDTK